MVDGKFLKILDSVQYVVFGLLDLFALVLYILDGGIEESDFALKLIDNVLEFSLVVGDRVLDSD
jgi:hypothetical protein